jgi:hypothetical protein
MEALDRMLVIACGARVSWKQSDRASLAVVGEARAAGSSAYTQQHNTMTGNLG